jgi:pimeloyl-ACP methyl ester carboxylesterase
MNNARKGRPVAPAMVAALGSGIPEVTMAEQRQLEVTGHARSADGVKIAYADQGRGAVAVVFIHGGLADRTFWAPQFAELAGRFRLVALDLGGHGASGLNRKAWTIASWAGDVVAVADALDLQRIVLVGNSLGGPVALEAAALLRGRVIGVIGVDTLHDATQQIPREAAHAQAEAWRTNFAGACHAMAEALFHPGTHPELQEWAEKRMRAASPAMAVGMMESFGGYDLAAAFRNADVPIRAINGDLWPTGIEVNRTIAPDFDAVIMNGAGHYPMLERPAEFDRLLVAVVDALDRATAHR